MAANTRSALSAQLPKHPAWTLERVTNLVGAIASTATLVFVFTSIDTLSTDTKMIFALSYLFLIIIFLIVYLLLITQRRLYRYAQAVFHVHFVNHVIRDHLASLSLGNNPDLKVTLNQILDSIAACHSIITGRMCRVSIKEVKPTLEVVTVSRDTISAASSVAGPSKVAHLLDRSTDFRNLWYCRDNCSRYFYSNNLPSDWKDHKYENTSFDVYGTPELRNVLGLFRLVKWPLPYKSTIVLPIRYLDDWTKRPRLPTVTQAEKQDEPPSVWGFLCVDSSSTRAFKPPHAAELGGAFADALYVLFTYSRHK